MEIPEQLKKLLTCPFCLDIMRLPCIIKCSESRCYDNVCQDQIVCLTCARKFLGKNNNYVPCARLQCGHTAQNYYTHTTCYDALLTEYGYTTCYKCNTQCTGIPKLRLHIRQECLESIIKCDYCGKNYKRKEIIEGGKHWRECHPYIFCIMCVEWVHIDNMDIHVKLHYDAYKTMADKFEMLNQNSYNTNI